MTCHLCSALGSRQSEGDVLILAHPRCQLYLYHVALQLPAHLQSFVQELSAVGGAGRAGRGARLHRGRRPGGWTMVNIYVYVTHGVRDTYLVTSAHGNTAIQPCVEKKYLTLH